MVHTLRVSYDEFDKTIQERKEKNIFVLLFGAENPNTGKSWCPDCVNADPYIRKYLKEVSTDSVLIEVSLEREDYKRKDNQFRHHPRIQLKAIPTLIKWTKNAETDKRLVEGECMRDNLLSAFFSTE